jgi:C-terminal processing protease CtpA/Prc
MKEIDAMKFSKRSQWPAATTALIALLLSSAPTLANELEAATAAKSEATSAKAATTAVKAEATTARAEATAAKAEATAAKAEDVEIAAAATFALRIAEQEEQIAEAQRQVEEASRAMAEAMRELEVARESKTADLERSRAELSRAHRALREASREVARAHREAEMQHRFTTRIQTINLGDRAVIGILLGRASERGIELAGVSPGGPAEEAGLKKGDLITSVRGTDLTDLEGEKARNALVETMADVESGEEIRIGYLRDGKEDSVMVKAEKREPSSWQSLIALPEPPPPPPGAPDAPDAPGATVWVDDGTAPRIVMNHGQSPDGKAKVMVIDDEALAEKISEIKHRMDSFEYMFIDEEGNRIRFNEEFVYDDDQFSKIGANAFNQANMWFGMSATSGLELASCNPALGEYFKTDRGVLVLNVNDDNSYGLQTGDVILSVAGDDVNTPAELIRALRNFEPGAEFEMQIKRERRDKTLQATLPDSRLGALLDLHK